MRFMGTGQTTCKREHFKDINNSEYMQLTDRLILNFCYLGNGNRSNCWNIATIRISKHINFCCFVVHILSLALAVFACSPAAFEVLKCFNIFQLPSCATLQAYAGAFLHEAGACHDSISQ